MEQTSDDGESSREIKLHQNDSDSRQGYGGSWRRWENVLCYAKINFAHDSHRLFYLKRNVLEQIESYVAEIDKSTVTS